MEFKKCIICLCSMTATSTTTKSVDGNGNSKKGSTKLIPDGDLPVLNRQLIVIFVLREFFGIPQDICVQLLKKRGNPCEWIVWCESCSILVEKAKDVFDQINSLSKQFIVLQEELKTAVRLSENKCQEKQVRQSWSLRDATEIIRDCFTKKQYDLGQFLEDCSIQCKIEDAEDEINKSENECSQFVQDDISSTCDEAGIDTFDIESENSDSFPDVKVEIESSEWSESETEPEDALNSSTEHKSYRPAVKFKKGNKQHNSSKETDFICLMCSNFFACKWNLKNHYVKVHGGLPFTCERCDVQMMDETDLEKHKNPASDHVRCTKCNTTFTDKCNLLVHCKKEHPGKYDVEMFLPKKRKPRRPTPEESIPCEKCGKSFLHFNNLKSHCKKYHPEDFSEMFKNASTTCLKCKEKFDKKDDLKLHIRKDHPKLFNLVYYHKTTKKLHPCPHCPFKTSKQYLQDHINLHLNIQPYKCDICDKSFKNAKVFRYHQRSKHYEQLGIKPIKCEHCGKMFKTPAYLQTHIKTVHFGEFKYFCSVCNRGFTQPSFLQIHMHRHKGEKPKLCEECGKSFLTSSSLKSHMRRLHTNERPHQCKTCDKKFSDSNGLKRHVNAVHSDGNKPHECQICHKKFPIKNYLYIHMRSHKKKGEDVNVEIANTSC